jgi:hypothetical protein
MDRFRFSLFSLLLLPVISFAVQTNPSAENRVRVEPAKNAFSVLIPGSWQRNEYDFLQAHQSYELKLLAPGAHGLEYALIEINYFADPHKSPERFIFEKQTPTSPRLDDVSSEIRELASAGPGVKAFEIRTERYPLPGVSDKQVTVTQQYVVWPLSPGYVVLVFDAPPSLSSRYQADFDQVVASFLPAAKHSSKTLPEVSDDEYQVYTDFLGAEYKGATDSLADLSFGYVTKARAVSGWTSGRGKLDESTLDGLQREFGVLSAGLIADYRARNASPAMILDRIMLHDLIIIPERDNQPASEYRATEERMRPLNLPGFNSSMITLSRVAFDQGKETALFHVFHFGGGPSTGHFVLMTRNEGKWIIRKTLMTDYLIH